MTQPVFQLGDKVRYQGKTWIIERFITEEVVFLGTKKEFCDMVPIHMLERISDD